MPPKKKKHRGKKQRPKINTDSQVQLPPLSNLSLSTADTTATLPDEKNRRQCHLLGIPLELRRQVYSLLLDTKHLCKPQTVAYTARVENGITRLKAKTPPARLSTAIMRVNKQTHDECGDVLWSSNHFVKLFIYSNDVDAAKDILEHLDISFVSTNPASLTAVTRHALDVEIIEHNSNTRRLIAMFPAALLPRLVGFLRPVCDTLPLWGQNHRIRLTVRNPYLESPQMIEKTLLEPWRCLTGLNNVYVGSQFVAPAYARDLRKDMMGSGIDPWKWLSTMTDHKDRGARLLQGGKINESCDSSALVGTVMIKTFHDPNQARDFRTMPEDFHRAVVRLRFQSELNMSLALLRFSRQTDTKGDAEFWSTALQSANIALEIAENEPLDWIWKSSRAPPLFKPDNQAPWYSDADRAKARFRHGSIMMALDEWGYACRDLELAQSLCPADPAIRNAYEEAKRRYDRKVRPGAALDRLGIRH